MSYMLTSMSLFGVTVTYDEGRRVLELAGTLGFLNEYQNDVRVMPVADASTSPVKPSCASRLTPQIMPPQTSADPVQAAVLRQTVPILLAG